MTKPTFSCILLLTLISGCDRKEEAEDPRHERPNPPPAQPATESKPKEIAPIRRRKDAFYDLVSKIQLGSTREQIAKALGAPVFSRPSRDFYKFARTEEDGEYFVVEYKDAKYIRPGIY